MKTESNRMGVLLFFILSVLSVLSDAINESNLCAGVLSVVKHTVRPINAINVIILVEMKISMNYINSSIEWKLIETNLDFSEKLSLQLTKQCDSS